MRTHIRALILLCFTIAVHANFSIEPATITIRIDRGENSAWLDVVHTGGTRPVAVELGVFERNLDMDGDLIRDPMKPSSDFVVHPAQIILQPGEQARVQVVYAGRQRGAVDKAYILLSQEVPLPLDEEGEGVRVGIRTLMNYYTVLAVSTGKPGRLTFVSSKAIGDGKVEVIVENKSGGRVPVNRLTVNVGREKIENVTVGRNSIMPGQQRRLVFEYGRAVTAKEVTFGF